MEAIIKAMLASLAPVSELRGGIPIAIVSGVNVFLAYFVCVIANMLVIPIVFLFLDYVNHYFMGAEVYRNFFNKHLERSKRRVEKHIGTKWEFIALMLFVAIPLPITGAYTGTLVAWFFKLNRRKSFVALGLGVLIAGLVVSFVVLSGMRLFGI